MDTIYRSKKSSALPLSFLPQGTNAENAGIQPTEKKILPVPLRHSAPPENTSVDGKGVKKIHQHKASPEK